MISKAVNSPTCNQRRNRRLCTGFTILEILIAITLSAVLAGSIATTSDSMERAFSTADAVTEGEVRGRRAMARVMDILMGADNSTITPRLAAPFSSTWIEFQPSLGLVAGEPTWDNTQRIQLIESPSDPDDGIDNDGNGIVDDCQIVWIQDFGLATEATTVISSSISEFLEGENSNGADDNDNGLEDERGFCVEWDGDLMAVRLTVESTGPDDMRVFKTLERTVLLRMGS
ncbi:MAG: prepilin-type N-terminal cleavage/methylation domain-containing protein [Planctomycetota bacterium]